MSRKKGRKRRIELWVIDIKSKQWLINEQFKYLRPSTLFGLKLEGCLQEWIIFKKKEEQDKAQFQEQIIDSLQNNDNMHLAVNKGNY